MGIKIIGGFLGSVVSSIIFVWLALPSICEDATLEGFGAGCYKDSSFESIMDVLQTLFSTPMMLAVMLSVVVVSFFLVVGFVILVEKFLIKK